MLVMGVETSCDETAVAIIDERKRILANIVYSQEMQHAPYGGVVPEIAARNHLQSFTAVLQSALDKGGVQIGDLDGVGATAGPGLTSSLIVGLLGSKTLALTERLPFIAANHLEGHVLAAAIEHEIDFPYFCLLVSGGHCQMLLVKSLGEYEILGRTLDDSAGETFDKVARMLGYGYPGGRQIETCAKNGNARRFDLPEPMKGQTGCDFSFAGLKTAVFYRLQQFDCLTEQDKHDMCASFQRVVGNSLISRVQEAVDTAHYRYPSIDTLVLTGGVAANHYLRHRFTQLCRTNNLRLLAPSVHLCTDNGAMIAWTALQRLAAGQRDNLSVSIQPRWSLDSVVPPSNRSQ